MRSLDKRDGLLLLSVSAGGALISGLIGFELFDSVDSTAIWTVGTAGLVVGLLCSWGCLRLSSVEPAQRIPGALWLVLPWYFLFLSQLAYIGFGLIPVEVVVGALCMARRIKASIPMALAVSTGVRGVILGVHLFLPGWL
jgi:hypothetical protein